MTTEPQNRVEALTWAIEEICDESDLLVPSLLVASLVHAAIEANDAWLAARGWKAVPLELTGKMAEAASKEANKTNFILPGAPIGYVYRAYVEAAPSPEECEPKQVECPLCREMVWPRDLYCHKCEEG